MSPACRRAARGLALALHLATGMTLVALWLRPLHRIDSRAAARQRQRLTRWWMRRLLAILHIRLDAMGAPVPGSALIVANHVSWLDIPCLLATADARFVAKTEVARWPLIGRLAAGAGTLFLARGSGAPRTADAMTSVLAAGERVVIFPEGTSTDGRAVRPFHARLYQAAIRAAVPVQAVAIRYPHAAGGTNRLVPFVGDDPFLPHLWRLLGEPEILATLRFCPPLAVAGHRRRELARMTHRQIAAALAPHLPEPVMNPEPPAHRHPDAPSRRTSAVPPLY